MAASILCAWTVAALQPQPHALQPQPHALQHHPVAASRSRLILAVAPAPTRPSVPLTDDGYSFDSEAFQRYGGSSAWLNNLLTTFQSRVLERVKDHLLFTIAISVGVAVLFGADKAGMLSAEQSLAVQACALPPLPHEAVGSFIGLLLAFRTSQAYDRFWEARTLWDGVYGSSRSIVRLATATRDEEAGGTVIRPTTADGSANSGDDPAGVGGVTTLIVGLTAAFPYALKQHLRGTRNVRELVEVAASTTRQPSRTGGATRQLVAASRQPNVPLAILDCLSRALLPLRKVHGDLVWWQMDSKVEEMISILGRAERIKGTPVPLSYSRHTSRFFSVYAFTLPLALVHSLNLWLLPPTVGIISWILFATEEIGHIIEEPFGRGLADDPDQPGGMVFAAGDDVGSTKTGSAQLEVLPLGRYCADIASDAATIFLSESLVAGEMPGGDDELMLFDELS